MKTITSELANHLTQTVTTLATLWKIVRTDAKEFYFTDHDQAITFEGHLYEATGGFLRSAIANSSGLSVDNLDVQGVFDGEQIQEEELVAGLFDYADIFISTVNWKDITQGQLKLRRGKFGEVMSDPRGFYKAELRGLAQILSQNVTTFYSPECRVDLGAPQCGIPILPPILGRGQTVNIGEFYRVPTKTTIGVDWEDIVRNAGFELDIPGTLPSESNGWKTVGTGAWRVMVNELGLLPFEGTQFLTGGNSTSGTREHIIPLDTLGLSLGTIDAGTVTADFSIQRANQSSTADLGSVVVEFLDTDGQILATALNTGFEVITPQDTWVSRSFIGTPLPAGTRNIRLVLSYLRVGSNAFTAFDGIALTLHETTRVSPFSDIYENRVYEVISAGITNELTGGTLVDNPSFEIDPPGTTAPITNWTIVTGGWQILASTSGLLPFEGTQVLSARFSTTGTIEQIVNMAAKGISLSDIDNGIMKANFSVQWGIPFSGSTRTAKVLVEFQNDMGQILGIPLNTGDVILTNADIWEKQFFHNIVLPLGTRNIHIVLSYTAGGSSLPATAFDDVKLTVFTGIPPGQPAYDTVIGNPTVDGTATLIARDSFSRDGHIKEVIDGKTFTIVADEPRAVDGWFSQGGLVMETSPNAGKTVEMKEWFATSSRIGLYMRLPFFPQPGTKLRLYAGCDKRLTICVSKFANAINFRGEPFLPGADALVKVTSSR